MTPSEIYKENADNCAMLAEGEPSRDSPAYKRYRRMEQAWRSLAEEQQWLDGEVPPVRTDRAKVSKKWMLFLSLKACGLVSFYESAIINRNFSFNRSMENGLPIAGAFLNSSSSGGPP